MSDGIAAFGTTLEYTDTGTAIGELSSIGGLKLNADELDLTHHGSPDEYREISQGLRDGGDFAIEGNLVPGTAGRAALMAHYLQDADGGLQSITVTFPDDSTHICDAFVKELDIGSSPVDGKLAFSATFRVTGEPDVEEEMNHPRDLLMPKVDGVSGGQSSRSVAGGHPGPVDKCLLYLGAGESGVVTRVWWLDSVHYWGASAFYNFRFRVYTGLGDLPETDPGGGAPWVGDPQATPDVDLPLGLLYGDEFSYGLGDPDLQTPALPWQTEFLTFNYGLGPSLEFRVPIYYENGVLIQLWEKVGGTLEPVRPSFHFAHYEAGSLVGTKYRNWRLRSKDASALLIGATHDELVFLDVQDEAYLVALFAAADSTVAGMTFVEAGWKFCLDNGTVANWWTDSYEDFLNNPYNFGTGRYWGLHCGTIALGLAGQSIAYRYFVRDAMTAKTRLRGSWVNSNVPESGTEDVLLHVATLFYSPSASG